MLKTNCSQQIAMTGPNQQVQDLGELLQDPGINIETEHFSGRNEHKFYTLESGYNTIGTQVMI
jgi:hypothetical protein